MAGEKPPKPINERIERTFFGESGEMDEALKAVRAEARREAEAKEAAKSPEQKRKERIMTTRDRLYQAMNFLYEKLESSYKMDLQIVAREETPEEKREREGHLSQRYRDHQTVVTPELAKAARESAAMLYPHLQTLSAALRELYATPQVTNADQVFATVKGLRDHISFRGAGAPLDRVAKNLAEFLEATK